MAKPTPNWHGTTRETAIDSAFLQASRFTSVVAFGVAAISFVVGVVLALIGLALRVPVAAGTGSEPHTRLTPTGVAPCHCLRPPSADRYRWEST